MPARSIDTATLAFGLVSIPVKIYSTSEHSHEVHFHYVHKDCGQRLHQQYVCPKHGEVDRDEMTKGFELTKGTMVELEKDELKALEAVASDEIALAEFVPYVAVDPLYIDKSYYLGPGKGGDRAYRLFRDALEDAEIVGIASYSARGKQYVVMVRPYEDGLIMHQLRYEDEIKPWSEVPLGKLPKAAPSELALAGKVISQLRHDTFDPSQYSDEVKGRVRKLIAKKAKGGEITVPEREERPPVTDLMEALKASLGGGNGHANASDAKDTKSNGHSKRSHGKRAHSKRSHTKRGAHTKRAHTKRAHTKRAHTKSAHAKRTHRGHARTSRSSRSHSG